MDQVPARRVVSGGRVRGKQVWCERVGPCVDPLLAVLETGDCVLTALLGAIHVMGRLGLEPRTLG